MDGTEWSHQSIKKEKDEEAFLEVTKNWSQMSYFILSIIIKSII